LSTDSASLSLNQSNTSWISSWIAIFFFWIPHTHYLGFLSFLGIS
jgi:hypothetical protein